MIPADSHPLPRLQRCLIAERSFISTIRVTIDHRINPSSFASEWTFQDGDGSISAKESLHAVNITCCQMG